MENETQPKKMVENDYQKNIKKKNWILLMMLIAIIALLFGLSFVKFGQAVYS